MHGPPLRVQNPGYLFERRAVESGRYTTRAVLSSRQGESWWVASAFSCHAHCGSCQGYEVCLLNIVVHGGGGGCSSPTWPVLSLKTKDAARLWMKRLMALARTIDAADRQYDADVNGDPRVAAWLTSQGFERHDHVCWWLKEAAHEAVA